MTDDREIAKQFIIDPLDPAVDMSRTQEAASAWVCRKTEEEIARFLPPGATPNDVHQVIMLDGHTWLMKGEELLCEYWFTMDTRGFDMRLTMYRRVPRPVSNAPSLGGASLGLSGDEPMLGSRPADEED